MYDSPTTDLSNRKTFTDFVFQYAPLGELLYLKLFGRSKNLIS
jgi:hypothetical protein